VGPNAHSKNPRTTSITLQQKENYKKNQSESSGDSKIKKVDSPQRKIMTGAQLIKQTSLLTLLNHSSHESGFLKTATHQLSFDQADIDNFLNLQKNANFESRGNSSTLDEKQLWGKLKSSLETIPKEETKKTSRLFLSQPKRSKTSNFESLSNLINLKLHNADENKADGREAEAKSKPKPKPRPKKSEDINSLTECALIFGIIPVEDFRNTLRSLQIASSRFNEEFKKEMDGKTPNPVFATINAVSAFVSSLQNSDKSKEK
jgi:hypothetical protein